MSMYAGDKELEQISDERFLRLMLAYTKAEIISGHPRFGELERIEVYRNDQAAGWKLRFFCHDYNLIEDVSPEQLYGWIWENAGN